MKKKKELNLDTPEHVDSGNMNPMHDICGCHDGIDMENTPQFHSTTNFPKRHHSTILQTKQKFMHPKIRLLGGSYFLR
jgi:hypothetical protein